MCCLVFPPHLCLAVRCHSAFSITHCGGMWLSMGAPAARHLFSALARASWQLALRAAISTYRVLLFASSSPLASPQGSLVKHRGCATLLRSTFTGTCCGSNCDTSMGRLFVLIVPLALSVLNGSTSPSLRRGLAAGHSHDDCFHISCMKRPVQICNIDSTHVGWVFGVG